MHGDFTGEPDGAAARPRSTRTSVRHLKDQEANVQNE